MKKLKLICIHGNSLTPAIFDEVNHVKAEKFSLTLPGHAGKPIGNTHNFLDLVDTVCEEIKRIVATEDKFILLGLSLGGHVCHHLLGKLNPTAIITMGAPPINLTTAGTAFLPHPHLGLLFKGTLSEEELTKLSTSMAQTKTQQEIVLAMIRQCNPQIREIIGASLAGGGFHDEIDLLSRYQGKKIFVHAEDDLFINGKHTENLHLGDFKLVAGSHALPLVNPKAINKILDDLISSLQ